MRPGRRLGVDVGSSRTGIAVCDRDGLLATPRDSAPGGDAGWDHVERLVAEEDVMEIVVGLPRSLSGGAGPAETRVREWAQGLAERVSVPVRLVDERMSTHQAARGLREGGKNSRQARGRVDSAAAAVILQHVLDTERASGVAPGEVVP